MLYYDVTETFCGPALWSGWGPSGGSSSRSLAASAGSYMTSQSTDVKSNKWENNSLQLTLKRWKFAQNIYNNVDNIESFHALSENLKKCYKV